VRTGATSGPANVRAVVAPEYVPGAAATLEPLAAADAVVLLAEHTFHLDRDPQTALDTLAELVGGARCYRLVSGDPDSGAAAVATALRTGMAG
jgi:hypothetical protein